MRVSTHAAVRGLTEGEWLLMGGWRAIEDAVRKIACDLRDVPDQCQCQSGGVCSCCRHDTERRSCDDCRAIVHCFRARVEDLTGATLRFLPAITDVVGGHRRDDVRRMLAQVEADVFAVDRRLRRLETRNGEFQAGCPAVDLLNLQALVVELRAHIERANELF